MEVRPANTFNAAPLLGPASPRCPQHPTPRGRVPCSPPPAGSQDSPLHDDEQTFPPLVEVLVDVHDADDVRALRRPPVQLHFPAGLGAILQHLREKPNPAQRPAWQLWGAGDSAPLAQCPGCGEHGGAAGAQMLPAGCGKALGRSVQCLQPHLAGAARSHPPREAPSRVTGLARSC